MPARGRVRVDGRERLAAAALTAAACAFRAPGDHAVLSFAAETQVLRDIASTRPTSAVVDRVLGLRGHGVTALSGALRAATAQLERTRAERRIVVLLSDCRATDDHDPVPAARGVPELLILAPESDHEQAAELAARSNARWAPVAGPSDAPGCCGPSWVAEPAGSQPPRTFTARDTTSAIVTSDTSACTSISIFAHRLNGITSVGLNAVALVNDRYR